jgi:RES domain
MVRTETGPARWPGARWTLDRRLESRRNRPDPCACARSSPDRVACYVILYRHADPRFPFLWEAADQPPGRWHAPGTGPAQYLADTPDGAWAEFLRHEGITDPADLQNVRRALWAVEVPDSLETVQPELPLGILTGGIDTYPSCQAEATRLRGRGAVGLRATSAGLLPGAARGWHVDGGLRPGRVRDGLVIVLFGRRPDLTGWAATEAGRPPADLLARARPL